MSITGKTPLFRARNLEALLGVGKIFLKLEGANPNGHKYDRLAEYLVRDSRFKKKAGILAEGPLAFIQSAIHFGNAKGVPVQVPICRGETRKLKLKGEYQPVHVKFKDAPGYRLMLDQHCQEENLLNCYNGVANINTSILALEGIGDELYGKFGDGIDSIFLQLSYGIGLTGIHNSFERRYVRGESQKTPSLYCCTTPKGNVIYENYRVKFQPLKGIDEGDDVSKHGKSLEIRSTELLHAALDAVYDTNGDIIGISDELLQECVRVLKAKEGVRISIEEAYSLAGLFKMARDGALKNGIHVVVLNDGKSNLKIDAVKKNDYTVDEIYQFVDMFLKQYTDSYGEITNAIANALEKGEIFLAKRNDVVQGIAVVVHTGFDKFIPTYHLGYIGTKEGNEGRGIASELLEEVVAFTGGNVSLHVDMENRRAMRVYEKVGFKHCYNRMIYKGAK